MLEQDKTRVTSLPCGRFCSGEKVLCGDCVFWKYEDNRGDGYCSKKGGYHDAGDYCYDGRSR